MFLAKILFAASMFPYHRLSTAPHNATSYSELEAILKL